MRSVILGRSVGSLSYSLGKCILYFIFWFLFSFILRIYNIVWMSEALGVLKFRTPGKGVPAPSSVSVTSGRTCGWPNEHVYIHHQEGGGSYTKVSTQGCMIFSKEAVKLH